MIFINNEQASTLSRKFSTQLVSTGALVSKGTACRTRKLLSPELARIRNIFLAASKKSKSPSHRLKELHELQYIYQSS